MKALIDIVFVAIRLPIALSLCAVNVLALALKSLGRFGESLSEWSEHMENAAITAFHPRVWGRIKMLQRERDMFERDLDSVKQQLKELQKLP